MFTHEAFLGFGCQFDNIEDSGRSSFSFTLTSSVFLGFHISCSSHISCHPPKLILLTRKWWCWGCTTS